MCAYVYTCACIWWGWEGGGDSSKVVEDGASSQSRFVHSHSACLAFMSAHSMHYDRYRSHLSIFPQQKAGMAVAVWKHRIA